MKKVLKKVVSSLKDASIGKSKFGLKGKSYLNPYTHGLHLSRQLFQGVKRGKSMANFSKSLGLVPSRSVGSSAGAVVATARPARSLASLTTR